MAKEILSILGLIALLAGGIVLIVLGTTTFETHQTIYAGRIAESRYAEVEAYATHGCGKVLSFRLPEEQRSRCPACNPQDTLWHYRLIVDDQCQEPLFAYDIVEESIGWEESVCVVFGAVILAMLALGFFFYFMG